jgi:anti-sigma B factor antagonist
MTDVRPAGHQAATKPAVLLFTGEIDVAVADHLRRLLDDALGTDPPGLIADLSEVTFMDSTGLSILVAALNRCRALGIPLSLRRPPLQIQRLLDLSGLTGVFVIEDV